MNLFFEVFRSFVSLPNSMSKLIANGCTFELVIKTTAAYVYANKQLRLCFDVLIRYFVVLDIHQCLLCRRLSSCLFRKRTLGFSQHLELFFF